ncbi:MAG: permease [Candidatus Staskawiczbacteria bacterium]|nr:permease [Candidatus Staskawiczbacteria bacterium]
MDIFYPIQLLADWLTYDVFSIAKKTLLGNAIDFFINDTIKIFLLLVVIIFVVSIIRSFLPPEKIKNILSHKGKYTGNILASFLGIITPFCTCSAIPLFLGFVEAGVPLGVTFSFLVASPMINEIALVMLFGLFGWKVAFIYIVSGLVVAIVSGIIIGKLKVENLVYDFKSKNKAKLGFESLTWEKRITYARGYTFDILKKVWLFIIIGVGIGAWIHGYIPADFIAKYAGGNNWYAVPLAILIGIPLYSNAAGIIPLVSVLTEKGVSMGTTLAFMMAVTGLSLPEFLILKKVMKTKLIIIFAGIVGVGIMCTGYLFNIILK